METVVKKEKGGAVSNITKLSVVGMFVSLGGALINTIWAVYLDFFLHSAVYVGLFSSVLTLVAIVSYFLFIPLIEKKDKAKIYFFSLCLFAVAYFLFAIDDSFILIALLALFSASMISLRVTSYGILVKDLSSKQNLSNNEGFIYTFTNIAFVVGPLIAGFVGARFGNPFVFFLAAIFMLVAILIFRVSGISGNGGKKRLDKNIFKNFFDFFKGKDRVVAYVVASGISMWWILIYLFVPLYIIRAGLSEWAIGVFLFLVALPLIFLEIYFAKKAGKCGFKKMFKFAYLLVAVIVVVAFFFSNIYFVLGLLVLASVGLAMLEPTTQAYFFDILKGKEEYRYYGPFNTNMDVGGLVAKLSGSLLLVFLPFKFLFLLFGGLMFLMFLLSFKVKGVVESRRKV